ncbi:Os10g0427100, partial [Oryza sativa Japonica Group]
REKQSQKYDIALACQVQLAYSSDTTTTPAAAPIVTVTNEVALPGGLRVAHAATRLGSWLRVIPALVAATARGPRRCSTIRHACKRAQRRPPLGSCQAGCQRAQAVIVGLAMAPLSPARWLSGDSRGPACLGPWLPHYIGPWLHIVSALVVATA